MSILDWQVLLLRSVFHQWTISFDILWMTNLCIVATSKHNILTTNRLQKIHSLSWKFSDLQIIFYFKNVTSSVITFAYTQELIIANILN